MKFLLNSFCVGSKLCFLHNCDIYIGVPFNSREKTLDNIIRPLLSVRNESFKISLFSVKASTS
jgi:hypothetical protein